MRFLRSLTTLFALVAFLAAPLPVLFPGLAGWGASPAQADVVNRITVSGTTRVEVETILAYVTIKPGRPFSAADIDESIKALFATGLFSDVRISRQGGALLVTVVENPVITRIAFEGNDRHSDEALTAIVELQPRSVLTQAKLQADKERILELYRRTGRYSVTVEPQIVDVGANRADLIFKINEGPRTEVKRITFVGNKAYSDGRLRDVVITKESGIFGWLKSSDNYDPDRLNADQEALRRFYYNHGYADFRIISAVADFDREQQGFFITFTVEEGEPYTYGAVNIETTLSELDPEALKDLTYTTPGATYSAREVEKTLEALTLAAAEKGYAFVQVRPRGERDYANRKIAVTYFVDEGARAYIERINIIGNTRTRDYVIRREFDVAEGDAYNQVLIEKAERRLNNLGYFKTVKIWSEPGSAPDRVIVNVQVEDQNTGEIAIGAGYSTSDGFIVELSVSEKNLLGRGQYVRAAVGRGENTQTYELSFTEPYFLDQRLSAGFDLYKRAYNRGRDAVHPYQEEIEGGGIRFGVPLNDELTANVRWSIYNQSIFDIDDDINEDNGPDSVNVVTPGDTLVSTIGYSLVYDTLDSRIFPREGIYANFSQDFAGAGGDVRFLKSTVRADYYREVVSDWGLIGHVGAKAGHVMGIGQDLRFVDHFRPGGELVRGFGVEGFGPRDLETGYLLGGQFYAAGTVEAIFPLPAVPQEFGFSGAVFADAGTVFDVDPQSAAAAGTTVVGDDGSLRASIGVGILWQSPFGLVRADVAYPVAKNDADRTQLFRFSAGTRF